ncbi:MAG: hypothetical protein K2X86_15285 [Cytophagaceae bacterium]|nr:hypothetical protein [Cytophagaceae bacterium]
MILILLVLIRLPSLIYGYPLLIPELIWQLSGEKMADGFLLYRDIWEGIEPFSGGAYFLIDKIFGESQFVYQILSLILVFIQAILFNFILNINNVYPERTFVPALLYIIFSSLFFDFYTLSPVLMGMTFVILAMHFVFLQIRTVDDDENLFYAGLLVASSSLFYFPFFIFLLMALLAFLLFTPSSIRKYFVLLSGFFFPYTVAGTYYFIRDGLDEFIYCLFYSSFVHTEFLVTGKIIAFTMAIPVIIFILSIFTIVANSRYINYQYVTMRIFGVWLILSVATLYFSRTISTFQLFVCVPPLSFFAAHFFLLTKNKYIREISFAAFSIIILWINYGTLYSFAFKKNPVNYEKMVADNMKSELPEEIKNKKLLVLGDDKSYYVNNIPATPYLNWDLSKKHFDDLNNFNNISEIYKNFSKDMPDVIIDKEKIAPALFAKIPKLGEQFRKMDGYDIYVRQ